MENGKLTQKWQPYIQNDKKYRELTANAITRFNNACSELQNQLQHLQFSIRLTVLLPIDLVKESTTAALSLDSRLRVRIITSSPAVSPVVSPES